jgi:diketogulonate reductase-like aldo/keto reductase
MKNTLDVVLLHAPWCWAGHCSKEEETYSWKEAWNSLEKIKLDGDVFAIGVSNFDVNLLQQLLQMTNTKVSVIQNWMDPFHQDKEVRKLCEENNIIYMAYSSQGTQWEGNLRYNPLHRSSLLINIAAKHNETLYQV